MNNDMIEFLKHDEGYGHIFIGCLFKNNHKVGNIIYKYEKGRGTDLIRGDDFPIKAYPNKDEVHIMTISCNDLTKFYNDINENNCSIYLEEFKKTITYSNSIYSMIPESFDCDVKDKIK